MAIAIGAVCYYFVYKPGRHKTEGEIAYVLPQELPVLNTTAVIHNVIATLPGGQPVRVTERIGEWAHVALKTGRDGWVKQGDLLDAKTHQQGQDLLTQLENMQVQATGRANDEANLHLSPSRDAPTLADFSTSQPLEVYGRRLVARPPQSGSPSGPALRDVWYFVRGAGRAGWVLGRFVDLSPPEGLAPYAQGTNMVAWLVLDTVIDGGKQVPQYLAADRAGARDIDFNHIRVFTWWVKRHKYVTAYVESDMDGYFPITVAHAGNTPYFRLRLKDDSGHEYQKVYRLFDTIVRSAGTVDGWSSNAMPPRRASRRPRRRLTRRRRVR
ncbi:MAG: SH3 domain-containing protein [Terriglobia bacterium]